MYQSKKNIIVGRNPVLEALKAGSGVDKLMMSRSAAGESIDEIKELAKLANVPLQYVPIEKLNALTNVLHQGVVAFKAAVQYLDLQQVIDWVLEKGEAPLLLLLDGITDVRNIGAIARTALCCGVHGIILPERGVAPLGEDAMKASAGALAHLQIIRVGSMLQAIDTLHLNGIPVFGSEMSASKKLYLLGLNHPCAIVMGSEDKGIHPTMRKACDELFSIPMTGTFESLNVSVATGMILYEALRQRALNV